MIKWCSYCLRFVREFEPYQDFEVSHGVCPDCLPKVLTLTSADQTVLLPLKSFYRALQLSVRSGQVADVATILEDSRRLGIRPIDLMMGVLQPMLAEIGELWAQGKVTVAVEHRFNQMAQDLTTHFRNQIEPPSKRTPPALLMFSAPENQHNLGLQMADFFFAISGIPALVFFSPLPLEEVLDLIRLHTPAIVGFSVALAKQLQQVQDVASEVKTLPQPPRHIILGGPAVRLGLNLDPAHGIKACRELSEIQELL